MVITPLVKPNSPQVQFSDLNPLISTEDPYELVFDEACIFRSIITILSTKIGSRVFNRYFGSKVEDYLWEPIDDKTADLINIDVKNSISKWEKRIRLTKTTVLVDLDSYQYYVNLEYEIPGLKNKASSFAFNLNRK